VAFAGNDRSASKRQNPCGCKGFDADRRSMSEPVKVEAAGIEPGQKSSGNRGVGNQSGAECGALGARDAPLDPDLAAVVDAWPALPAAIKAGILAMIRAAK
jgi:hypothetical protein